MNSRQKFLIEKIAQRARQLMVERKLIEANDCFISNDKMAKIISSFGGTLKKSNEDKKTEIEKTKDNKFIVYYDEKSTPLDLLHELGHAFFDLPSMNEGETYPCDGDQENDVIASLFARSFYMPRDPFEMATIKCSIDGKCDIQKVADIYDVGCFDILTRGEELNIWR